MESPITVATGEVKLCSQGEILRSSGIGSCVAVVVIDCTTMIGGIAHVMLPGFSVSGSLGRSTRYAGDAIAALLAGIKSKGVELASVEAFLVGGGNVLKKEDDTICRDNLASVEAFLVDQGVAVCDRVVGGTANRTVHLDLAEGCVTFTENNSGQKVLWKIRGE